jgi:4-amino-4-deoxy-L-arabinose transferase-like glycosyltransferase
MASANIAAVNGRASVARAWSRHWSVYAWVAIGATATFIAITCWWLTQDRSIPIYDAGDHLRTAIEYHGMLASGNLLEPFTQRSIYPILGGLVGALAAFVGGVSVAAPIIGENLVFVSLLALGCYQTGRLLFGRLAGMFAVLFVLGSPLLISLFHEFMLDAPLTALVSVSVWLILASEDFSRPGVAGAAGLAVGLGLNMKSQFPLFVVGLLAIVLAHGGWRNRRGLAIFCVAAAVVGLPWYVVHFGELGKLLELGGTNSGAPPGNTPPTFSTDNLLWYFWSVLNSQLLAPLFVLAAGGALWMLATLVRGRGRPAAQLELLAGAFAAWLAITLTPHHDIRYGVPLLAFTAVIGTGWITRLPRTALIAAIALLMLGVAGNTLGVDFGVGREVKLALAGKPPGTEQSPDLVILYSTSGFLVAAPSRDGDVPGLLDELRRGGVRTLAVSLEQSEAPDFSIDGIFPLAMIAGLSPTFSRSPEYTRSADTATLIHEPVSAGGPPACTRLSDGTGVWAIRYDASGGAFAYYCPTRRPQFYDFGAVD